MDIESIRIAQRDPTLSVQIWEKWGTFVADRAWGTVREDYSADGDAWNFFPHDHARKRAFRWGDDAIAGLCDRFQVLLLAPAFWNGQDPILKERLFGTNSNEGNHGEDVKELYYPLDATPSGSYSKYLYKYPQAAYPYEQLIQTNESRNTSDREFELIDTGIFDQNKYFDVFIEYAKADPEDICMRIEAFNRGPNAAPLHLIPQLWFRNQWSWNSPSLASPTIEMGPATQNAICLVSDDTALASPKFDENDYHLGKRYLYATAGADVLFTNNETDCEVIWNTPNDSAYVKDGIEQCIIHGDRSKVNPANLGTKAGLHYTFPSVPAGQSVVITLRLTPKILTSPLADVASIILARKNEADAFYIATQPKSATDEERMIQRQSYAGMHWNKQLFFYWVSKWMDGDALSPPSSHSMIRNTRWLHLSSMRIFSMPDKWEYPWFASWDLCFHSVCFAETDVGFAKDQLLSLLTDRFQHPNGQISAYEWEFSDVNPPIQAWAALQIFEIEKKNTGSGDREFLEICFQRLLLNFTWWVNKVDKDGDNVFEGGFLGMDNIGIFNRSSPLSPGFVLDEVDGVGWVALLCLNMMRISLLLAEKNSAYESMAIKFLYHYTYLIAAMSKGRSRNYDLWSSDDHFFHSYYVHPDGNAQRIPDRSLTGVVPFFASDVWAESDFQKFPTFYKGYLWLMDKRPDLTRFCIQKIPQGNETQVLFSPLNLDQLPQFLSVLWNPAEFRSDYGLRSLSKFHLNNPVILDNYYVTYEPGESLEKMMGGNSNWRGPIWLPINFLCVKTLLKLSEVLDGSVSIQAPGEKPVTLSEMALSLSESMLNLFKVDAQGNRPMFGDTQKFQTDPNFKDYLFFFEHFHGDNGRGIGAAHQNGWTGLISNIIQDIRSS
jgi:hypothetical protein